MEYDRFSRSSKLYILGMISLVICLGLFFFSLYILPNLIWGLDYDVPDFIASLLFFFQDEYDYSAGTSKLIVWLIFFVPCLITGVISDFVSNYIDSKIYKNEVKSTEENPPEKEVVKRIKESVFFGFKILGLMVVIIIIIFLLQLFVQLTA